jgi:hypothetical protein
MFDEDKAKRQVWMINNACAELTRYKYKSEHLDDYEEEEEYQTLRNKIYELGGMDEYYNHYLDELKIEGDVK